MSAAVADTPSAPVAAPSQAPGSLREALPIFTAHASPRILLGLLTVTLVTRVAVGGFGLGDAIAIAVILVYWPLQEWLLHVFLLHRKPFTLFGRTIDGIVPRKHRAHHRDPWNYEILFIPLHSYLYSVPILIFLAFAIAPTTGIALTAMAFHLLLALHYEAVHFLVHTRVSPRTAFYKRLWRNHRLHHFKNEHYWFGVTMLSGDHLLRTQPDAGAVETSPTARTLLPPSD